MRNYSNIINNTPQSRPLPGRTDMVKNNAGGYSFLIKPQEQLERFLLIGSEGGTYYVSEQKLTEDNAKSIIALIKTNGVDVVKTVIDFATNNRAPKADPGLFVLALAATYGDAVTKQWVYRNLTNVVKTSTHLFIFLSNIQNLRGWSGGLRRAVAKFYTSKTDDRLAYQLVKYRNRAGFTHKDAIKLSHPVPTSDSQSALLKYAIGKANETEISNKLIQDYGTAQTLKGKALAELVANSELTWEMVPTSELNDKDVLKALLENMPLFALIRNLNRFAKAGLTDGSTMTTKIIVSKLRNEENVKKSGIHPLVVVNSMVTYSSGRGALGNSTWSVNQSIVDALQDTYELALKTVVPTGKNVLIGVDISGSMQAAVNGMQLNAAQIANVLAVTMLKTEPNAELIWFDTKLSNPTIGRRTSIDDVIRQSPHGGGTDCALPIQHAIARNTKYDVILILTDNETWAGNRHSLSYIEQYRRSTNKDVKIIEVALAANPSSNIPDKDVNLLRIVGFDASVIQVLNKFLE